MESKIKILKNEAVQKGVRIETLQKKLIKEQQELQELETTIAKLMKELPEPSSEVPKQKEPEALPAKLPVPKKRVSWAEQAEEDERIQQILFGQNPEKYYVVFDGPQKGIYQDWGVVHNIVNGKSYGFKSYEKKEEAEAAYKTAFRTVLCNNVEKISQPKGKIQLFPQRHPQIRTVQELVEENTITREKFTIQVNALMNYSELTVLRKLYPVNTKTGVKAAFLQGADPREVNMFFKLGLISEIYLSQGLQEITKFPSKFVQAVRKYQAITKGRQIMLSMVSTLPIFDEDKEVLSPFTIVNIRPHGDHYTGRSTENRIPGDREVKISFYNVLQKLATITEAKEDKNIFVNFRGGKILMLSQTRKKITSEMKKEVEVFQEPFTKLNGPFTKLSEEDQREMCLVLLEASRNHMCKHCEESYATAYPKLDDGSSDDSLNIIIDNPTA
ncbi:translational transactivator [Soymovirus malvae]|nr:translational transactivator [Malva associated soymovirus 1]